MSPLLTGPWSPWSAKAAEADTSPTPAVIAPAATIPFFKNDRRFLRPPINVSSFFITFSFLTIESSVFNGRSHTRTVAGKPAKRGNLWSRVTVSGSQIAVPLVSLFAATPLRIGNRRLGYIDDRSALP